MSGEKAHKSIRKYGKQISTLGVQITLQFDINSIHDFRTTVKKLHALRAWLSTIKKLPKPFKKIYHISGELRNAQEIFKHTDEEKDKLEGFRNWLKESFVQSKDDWNKTYDPEIIRHLRKKIEHQNYKEGNRKKLKRFSQKNITRIKSILDRSFIPDEALHEARKILKDMQFVYAWSEEGGLDDGQKQEALKRIGEQAGNFNDQRIAVMLLSDYLKVATAISLHQVVTEIKQKWEESKERQKNELLATLNAFVKDSSGGIFSGNK